MKRISVVFLAFIIFVTCIFCFSSCMDTNSIESIKLTSSEGVVDTYTIIFSDGESTNFKVTNGAQGIQGIQGVPGKDGRTPTITIVDGYWYIDGQNTLVKAEGIKGETGNGISSITYKSTSGLVDTYVITFTDGSTTEFTVTNGKDGANGAQGIQGIQGVPGKDGRTPTITIVDGYWYVDGQNTLVKAEGIKGETGNGISSITYKSTSGLVDTYVITFTDGSTTEFTVTNGKDGANGAQGIQGIQGVPGKDGRTPTITIVEGYWYVDGQNTLVKAEGIKGETGNGISSITYKSTSGLVDTYVITFTDGSTTEFTVTNGKDGEVPHIAENGNWWIGDVDTGVKATLVDYEIMYNCAAVSIDWYDEQSEVYYIKDVYDFNGIAYLVNVQGVNFDGKTLILEGNLDFDGIRINTIGNLTHSFAGTFDGNGHCLLGIEWNENDGEVWIDPYTTHNGEQGRIYVTGLFYKNYGTIKNFTISGYDVDICIYERFLKAHEYNTSLLVTYNYGTITEVNAYGESKIIHENRPSSSLSIVYYNDGVISNCYLSTNVDIISSTGAVINPFVVSSTGVISNCHVSGNVCVKNVDTYDVSIGGVLGGAVTGSTLTQCTSSLYILVEGDANLISIGGVVCGMGHATVADCSFNGKIKVVSENSENYSWRIGGIASYADFGEYKSRTVISNCTVDGTISVVAKKSAFNRYYNAYMYVGGIIGEFTVNSIIENNLFNGRILVDASTESNDLHVFLGGIIGSNLYHVRELNERDYTTVVRNCKNTGEIFVCGKNLDCKAGGIVGYSQLGTIYDIEEINVDLHKITYEDCTFEGEMTVANVSANPFATEIGGIAGDAASVTIKDSSVLGSVEINDVRSVCYGEIVGSARYSVFLDGGKTKTRVENCEYGNIVYSNYNEYRLQNLMGASAYTELIVQVSESELAGMENYALLAENEKDLYKQIYVWAREIANHEFLREYHNNFNGEFYAYIELEDYGVSANRALDIYYLVIFDSPELIHLSSTGVAISDDETILALCLNDKYTSLESEHTLNDDEQILDNIKNMLLESTIGMNDYEKLVFAYNFLINVCEYAFDGNGDPIVNDNTCSLAGVLVDGYAVCEGYALAFNYFCDILEINSFVMTSQEMNHAWNIVELDGEWYYVDITWADTSEQDYFLMGSDNFCITHNVYDEFIVYPVTSSDDYAA